MLRGKQGRTKPCVGCGKQRGGAERNVRSDLQNRGGSLLLCDGLPVGFPNTVQSILMRSKDGYMVLVEMTLSLKKWISLKGRTASYSSKEL